MTLTDLTNILFRASQAEYGLLLRVSDPPRAMRAFARAREAHPEVELPPVSLRELAGHPEGNLVLLSASGAAALRAARDAHEAGDLTPPETW